MRVKIFWESLAFEETKKVMNEIIDAFSSCGTMKMEWGASGGFVEFDSVVSIPEQAEEIVKRFFVDGGACRVIIEREK